MRKERRFSVRATRSGDSKLGVAREASVDARFSEMRNDALQNGAYLPQPKR